MNRCMRLVLWAAMAAASAAGADVVFHKSKVFDSHGKDNKVDLVFLSDKRAMVVRRNVSSLTEIPYDAIDKVAYGYSQRHRVKEGAGVIIDSCGAALPLSIITCPAGVAGGPVVMLTKSKNHWLYVDYKDAFGSRQLVLMLDKSEYQTIISTTKAQTGKDVEALPEEGKKRN